MNILYRFLLIVARKTESVFFPGFRRKFVYELRSKLKMEIKAELMTELKKQLKDELTLEIKADLWPQLSGKIQLEFDFENKVKKFVELAILRIDQTDTDVGKSTAIKALSMELRRIVQEAAGITLEEPKDASIPQLLQEIQYLQRKHELLAPAFKALNHKRILYAGQAYYNAWYLSRGLRSLGWQADVLNWDTNPSTQIYYHGEDYSFSDSSPVLLEEMLGFYVSSLYAYDVFHFSNAHGISFGWPVQNLFKENFSSNGEIFLLKQLSKKIVYSNNGCLDGVSQSAFSKWGPVSVCSICRWQNEPTVCSDQRNLEWGAFRNAVADYQCLLGGNRVDYNDDPRVHEVPEFYCLDPEIWDPECQIPDHYQLPALPAGGVRLYHAVGHKADRTRDDGVNIKSSHIYLPLVDKLKAEGLPLDLLEPTGVPNIEVRFLQMQADIFLEMLTFGWFGANAREAMMLGKPVICFIRAEWLESVRREIPAYADELPIISATPETVEGVLRELIANVDKRKAIGKRSREFALKWHSSKAAASRFDKIYSELLFPAAGKE